MREMQENGVTPETVHIANGGYLLDAMMTLGPIRAIGGGGRRPADWTEIAAFIQTTGRITETWEAEAMHGLCGAFFTGLMTGENPMGIYPSDQ